MERMVEVVAIGNIVNDFSIGTIEEFPALGQMFAVDRIVPVLGGTAAIMASGLGKMGIKVKLLGKIGEDIFGDFVLERLNACGVDTTGIKRINDAQTPITLGFVNREGKRRMLHCFGTDAVTTEDDFELSRYSADSIFYVGGIDVMLKMRGNPLSRVLKRAKNRGFTTVLDTVFDPFEEWFPVIEPSIPYIDVFITSMKEAKHYAKTEDSKEMIRFFHSHSLDWIVLKKGEKGCLVYENRRVYVLNCPDINTIDTIGAGDNFVAGYIAGMAKGYSPEDCARIGIAAGSLSTECIGGEASYSGFEEVWNLAKTIPVIEGSNICRDIVG
jgi:sugar/nucleoside kinase (ribokinase family)